MRTLPQIDLRSRARRSRVYLATGGVVLAALALALLLPTSALATKEPAAVAKAERLLAAMGGQDALDATRFVRFNFFGFRTHHWDRWTGRYRLEGKNREGQAYVVLFDTDTKEGRAWRDGAELEGEDKAQFLEMGFGAFINDTYWLLMPYKLLDPGVHLADGGQETVDGTTYDVVKLTFDSVGLTPGDTYWAYLDTESGMMKRWAYHLEGWEADREKTVWEWSEWQEYGGIMLSSKRRDPASGREAALSNIAVFETLPDTVFSSPAPVE